MTECEVIGRKIKELRIAKGLTQSQLGFRLGLSQVAVSNIETGQTWIRLDRFFQFCVICDVDPDLFRRELGSALLFRDVLTFAEEYVLPIVQALGNR